MMALRIVVLAIVAVAITSALAVAAPVGVIALVGLGVYWWVTA